MVLVSKKSFSIDGPVGVGKICNVVGDRVGGLSGFDVGVKLLDVHNGDGSEDGNIERYCSRNNAFFFSRPLVKTGQNLCGFTVA